MVTSPQFTIQIVLFYLLILTVSGCTSLLESTNNITKKSNVCPEKPQGKLTDDNVKQVFLDSHIFKDSRTISAGKTFGYSFDAKSGQKLNYQINQDVCLWLYTPDNQLLNSKVLPKTGKYTIQLANIQGVETVDLQMGLDSTSPNPSTNKIQHTQISTSLNNVQASTPSISTSNTLTNTEALESAPISNRPAADEFVRQYYLALQDHNYNYTWNKLSPQYKILSSNGYDDYLHWWNSVHDIRIGNISLISESNNMAVVDAELYYTMNNGKSFKDYKKRIYLIWNEETSSWLFERKVAP